MFASSGVHPYALEILAKSCKNFEKALTVSLSMPF
jgi:hypothetical protein